ncbi:Anion-transporting ATPase, ArsA/GET3 family [Pedococcus dokdonensis]|uniref:Anion-transporting ATPase, ArsA/GET3 family n=1 Tax=Pedococcus dokdonensis TaxID=443156 RepID=A0A1H0UJ86_9MICO|nr:ArsA family ATPase [Pedococcus dokdonensis]SDP66105.1 Anion-transporting ATPase, ArsA/GET3 family [Pedococcus dokdonensis]
MPPRTRARKTTSAAPAASSSASASAAAAPRLDLAALLTDPATRIVVCCGAGGVGKTTTAAALGLWAAEHGRRVVVLTIDPARRLAQSLGLTELDNTPRPVAGIGSDAAGGGAGGSLDAMMLDMKRTFDEVVEQHATPEKAAQILANPFYQAVSSSFAGTQEYMAMEKLGQLRAEAGRDGRWDLIVVDTPPSRSALDFLDAPKRLGSFLDGRFIRLLSAPAKAGGRAGFKVFSVGVNVVTGTLSKVLGGQLLQDVQTFVAALDTMFGGFRERADQTYALLKDSETAFVVVAAPERDALREASFFAGRLDEEGMPLAGLVVNRIQRVAAPSLTAARALAGAEQLADAQTDPQADPQTRSTTAATTEGLLRLHAALAETAARQERLAARFTAGHPGIPVVEVPASAQDIHDLDGLRAVGTALTTP